MELLITLFNLLFTAFVFHAAWLWWEDYRVKKIYIVEDSEIDRLLIESKINADNCRVTFFYSCERAIVDICKYKPDLVLIDHNLKGKIKGSELLKYCLSVNIPAFLVTGESGAIVGIDEDYVIRKTYDEAFFARIRQLTNRAAA